MCGSPMHQCRRVRGNPAKGDASKPEARQECVEARCIDAGGGQEMCRAPFEGAQSSEYKMPNAIARCLTMASETANVFAQS